MLPVRTDAAASILDLRHEITDTAIVFPESMHTDVHMMRKNWYLRNYTALDTVVSDPVPATDQVVTARLAAMPTTIEMPFNQVVRSHIDLYVDRRRSLVETMLGMSLYYMPIFEEALEREGLPLELKYLPVIESALNPDAVSRAGATGLWQFMLATARGLGMEINTLVDERRDPIVSSAMAAKYLKQLHGIYGDWGLAIASYNCGPGNVNKALLRAGASADNPKDYWDIYYYLPQETRGYVPAFIAANYAMTYYADHGISPTLAKRPIITDTVHVNSRIEFSHISKVLNLPEDELRLLNPQYRKGIIPGDVKPYTLRLPSKLIYAYLMSEDSIKSLAAACPSRRAVVNIPAPAAGTATKWHKVRRGETMGKIASRYGVTVADIKRWNNLNSTKLRRGQRIKVQVAAPAPSPVETPSSPNVPSVSPTHSPAANADSSHQDPDSLLFRQLPVNDGQQCDSSANSQPEMEKAPVTAPPATKQRTKTATPKTSVHCVKQGDTLWKIAKQHNTTVAKLQKLNGLDSSSKLSIGQRLKIPAK